MKKIRIHIASENVYMDDDVFVNIELPYIPQIDNHLHLTDELYKELKIKAKSNLEIASRYCPKWFYGKSYNIYGVELKEENLEDIAFEDAVRVSAILYNANSEIVEIELTDD